MSGASGDKEKSSNTTSWMSNDPSDFEKLPSIKTIKFEDIQNALLALEDESFSEYNESEIPVENEEDGDDTSSRKKLPEYVLNSSFLEENDTENKKKLDEEPKNDVSQERRSNDYLIAEKDNKYTSEQRRSNECLAQERKSNEYSSQEKRSNEYLHNEIQSKEYLVQDRKSNDYLLSKKRSNEYLPQERKSSEYLPQERVSEYLSHDGKTNERATEEKKNNEYLSQEYALHKNRNHASMQDTQNRDLRQNMCKTPQIKTHEFDNFSQNRNYSSQNRHFPQNKEHWSQNWDLPQNKKYPQTTEPVLQSRDQLQSNDKHYLNENRQTKTYVPQTQIYGHDNKEQIRNQHQNYNSLPENKHHSGQSYQMEKKQDPNYSFELKYPNEREREAILNDKMNTPGVMKSKPTSFKTPSSLYKQNNVSRVNEYQSSYLKTPQASGRLQDIKEDVERTPRVQYSIPINHYENTIEKSRSKKKSSILEHAKPSGILWSSQKYSTSKTLQERSGGDKENSKNTKISESRKVLFENTFKTIVVKNTSYIVLKQLGKGGSSVVYHCYDPITQSERAIKKVNLSGEDQAPFINEIKLLSSLQKCDRVITMYDYEVLEQKDIMYVVLEKGDVDLSTILKSLATKTDHLPLHMLIFYWMEMLLAVKQIHDNGIIHSDLKPANFLKTGGGLKLIDFGIASCMQTESTSIFKDIALGTFNYISPEALSSNDDKKYKISFKSDVWSLGCILYQLVYKKTPFQHITNACVKFSTIVDRNHKISYPTVKWAPPQIIKSIQACLRYEMRSRPSIDELIEDCENYCIKQQ